MGRGVALVLGAVALRCERTRPSLRRFTPSAWVRYSRPPNPKRDESPSQGRDESAFSGGVSNDMTAQTPRATEDGVTSLIARLRAEHASQTDRSLQALLQHEIGVLEETGAEEAAAVRDYLGAFNADPQLREPSSSSCAFCSGGNRQEPRQAPRRAHALGRQPRRAGRGRYWERAAFAQDYEQNLGTAKDALQEAVASNPEDATPWLELELLAGKDGRRARPDAGHRGPRRARDRSHMEGAPAHRPRGSHGGERRRGAGARSARCGRGARWTREVPDAAQARGARERARTT
jgi:hypothetical protein